MQEGVDSSNESNNSHAQAEQINDSEFQLTGCEKRDKTIKRFFDAMVRTRGVITMACSLAGVSRKTIYEWQKQHDWFKEAVERYQIEYRGEWLENQLFKLCEEGDTQAVKFALQNKRLSRFGYAETRERGEDVATLSESQIALLKRTGIEVVNDTYASQHEGRKGNIALPFARKPSDIHGTSVH